MTLSRRSNAGFSIVELMVVIGVIGLLLLVLGPQIRKLMGGGEKAATKSQMQTIQSTILSFRAETGRFPTSLNEMTDKGARASGFTGPFLEEKDLVDSFKAANPFVYNKPPRRFKDKYKYWELYSFGANGVEGADNPHIGE